MHTFLKSQIKFPVDDKYIPPCICANTDHQKLPDILMYSIDEINDKYYKKYLTLAIIQKDENVEVIDAYMSMQSDIELFIYSEQLLPEHVNVVYIDKYICNIEIKRHYVVKHIKQYVLEELQ